jgi:hypothetical protein
MHPKQNIRKIMKIASELDEIHRQYKSEWKTWLPSDPNAAFLVCVGAGPWKEHRRKKVQEDALEWYHSKYNDLSAVNPQKLIVEPAFPLVWQNKMVFDLATNLRTAKFGMGTFSNFCDKWKTLGTEWDKSIRQFFEMCEHKGNGTKVLWLFVRDYLELPAFPIDRHVEDFLKKLGLPINPWYITDLCMHVNIDPGALNRYIFFSKSTNFSWSDEDEQSRESEGDNRAASKQLLP